ncbi:hypothetical protein A8990_112129 [Paenibacillus taihuensis]|uniref:LysM domain-containing protein n=1 Tax=Paenibacillus taihuensis TaxID=1156355 RepID=A0A3D9S901_9BACL|nr:hypothetical protein [Paenibacillus taihuensis]REE85400.1 hypothetical protein A8990_112129 [Paenibacillus taihuensis]
MNKTMKAIGLTAAIAVMIPLSAYAATTTNSTSTSTSTTATTNSNSTQQQGKFGAHPGQRGGFGGGAVSQEVLDLLKLDAAALKEKFASGKTLAQVATEQGVSRDDLKKAMTAAFDKQQATEKQAFTDNLDKLVDSQPGTMDGHFGGGKGGFGMGFGGKGGFHFERKTDINAAAAPVLGMTADAVNTALKSGDKSLADLAKDRGVDAQKVIDAVKQAIIDDLNASVKAGDLTQAQADKAIADAANIAENTVNGKGARMKMEGRFGGIGNADLSGAAAALGVTAEDLKKALASGKTLADVAKDKGVDAQKVIDAVKKTIVDNLNAAATAGKLTQEQADKAIANAEEQATNLVNGKLGRQFHGMGNRMKGDGAGASSTTTTTSASSATSA